MINITSALSIYTYKLLPCGEKIYHNGFNLPESRSHQLLFVAISKEQDQVPDGHRTQAMASQEEKMLSNVAPGEVRKARAASWSRRQTSMPFFIAVMRL